jgi:glycogen operon protein
MLKDDCIYVAMNMYWDGLRFELPRLPNNKEWYIAVNTDMQAPEDFYPPHQERKLENQQNIIVGGRSIIVLTGK